MGIKGFIKPNEDFQTSINIAYDLGNENKVKTLIPTASVCRYVKELLDGVIGRSNQRAKILVGAYGKGKSHIALCALMAMSVKKPSLYERITKAYYKIGSGFADAFSQFVESGIKLLPVVVSGSSTDISRSLLKALREALEDAGIDGVMPRTNYAGALETLTRWRTKYPQTYAEFERLAEKSGRSIENELNDYDTKTYTLFVELYPKLTSGGSFDEFSDADTIVIYETVLKSIKKYGYSGIYVVYDEFSKYLEANIENASVEDIKLLQNFAERCNRSEQDEQLHLLLISHKNLSNYIDSKLPKEKVDGWRGVSGRFSELEIHDDSNQSYELMSKAIGKDGTAWSSFYEANCDKLWTMGNYCVSQGIIEGDSVETVVLGCYPLHPVTAFILPRVSEIVAQNERTLFTFLSADEAKSLPQIAKMIDADRFCVTPDSVYDYFEPLLRKEHYQSMAHELYKLVHSSVAKVGDETLEARIIKTVALIYLASRFSQLPPSKALISRVFCDSGMARQDVEDAIDNLVDKECVIYLKRSNSYLKLKEASGTRIDEEVDKMAALIAATTSVETILNDYQSGKAAYPSRHNEEYAIARYFEYFFEAESVVRERLKSKKGFVRSGDGVIVGILPKSAKSLEGISKLAREASEQYPMTVFVIPKKFREITQTTYRYAAAKQLREQSHGDEVLSDEYSIVLEDCVEVLSRFVASYFRPELKEVRYFVGGSQKYNIVHRKRMSDLLSDICDEAFPHTPIINNEVINKNEPSGAALHSRAKILTALCGKNIEPNLGFIGNGQESSIMRSTLGITGTIENLETSPHVNIHPKKRDVLPMLDVIEHFVLNPSGWTFDILYMNLSSVEGGVGAKRGPVPIYLALVMREHSDSISIMRDGVERPLSAETLEDIEASPESFSLSITDWNENKSRFVKMVYNIFGDDSISASRQQAVDSIRRWFVSLPQFTRNARTNHASCSGRQFPSCHEKFMRVVKQNPVSTNAFLFEDIPIAFDCQDIGEDLVEALRREKERCESFVPDSLLVLGCHIQKMIAPNALEEESLSSTFADWLSNLSDSAKCHVFSGVGDRIMAAIRNFTPDEQTSLIRIAKAATSLRIEDWNDLLYESFLTIMRDFFDEVAKFEDLGNTPSKRSLAISFPNGKGESETRSFESVEYSSRARLLRNQITSSIDEMGQSITQEEKRQVVFEILRSMC